MENIFFWLFVCRKPLSLGPPWSPGERESSLGMLEVNLAVWVALIKLQRKQLGNSHSSKALNPQISRRGMVREPWHQSLLRTERITKIKK